MKKWIAAMTVWLSLNQLFGLGEIFIKNLLQFTVSQRLI